MQIQMSLNGILTDSDLENLAEVLGVAIEEGEAAEDSQELADALSRLCRSAIAEYSQMLLEGGMPSRGQEALEQRLFHMILHYFEGRIPDEPTLPRILNENLSRSRTLIRNVLARFGRDLEDALHGTLAAQLDEATEVHDEDGDLVRYTLVIQSDNALDRLNQVIAREAPHLDPIRKVPNSARVYRISPDAFEVLRAAFVV